MSRTAGVFRTQALGAALALSVLLAACGGGGPVTSTLPTPDPGQTYNPAASLTQAKASSVPYHGDWVMVADLMSSAASDATVIDTRYGVVSVSADASSASFVNAGGGVLAWCRNTTCTSNDETGTAIVGSVNVSGNAVLAFGMVPRNSSTPRFFMTDDDGLVDIIDGSPVIAGVGEWTENGTNIPARLTFVQTSSQANARALSLGAALFATPANQAGLMRALQVSHASITSISEIQARSAAVRSALQGPLLR